MLNPEVELADVSKLGDLGKKLIKILVRKGFR
jgi:hypothetical protein